MEFIELLLQIISWLCYIVTIVTCIQRWYYYLFFPTLVLVGFAVCHVWPSVTLFIKFTSRLTPVYHFLAGRIYGCPFGGGSPVLHTVLRFPRCNIVRAPRLANSPLSYQPTSTYYKRTSLPFLNIKLLNIFLCYYFKVFMKTFGNTNASVGKGNLSALCEILIWYPTTSFHRRWRRPHCMHTRVETEP